MTIIANTEPVNEIGNWIIRWWPIWSPILLVVLTGVIGGIFLIVNRRGADKTKLKMPLPPTWPEMWKRIDDQDASIRELEGKFDEAVGKIEFLVRERSQIIAHVQHLELLVPQPPGPPPRPKWEDEVVG